MDMRAEERAAKQRLIDRAAEAAGEETAARFVRCFFDNVPPVDLENLSAEDAAACAADFLAFAQERPAGRPSIRFGRPDQCVVVSGRHSIIDIVNDDMPFLVDTVTAEINRQGRSVHLAIHPIVRVVRDADGRLRSFHEDHADNDDAGAAESWMRLEIDQQDSESAEAELRAGLERVLGDVRAAVEDWQAMEACARDVAGKLHGAPNITDEDVAEARDFLHWLEEHFTFLGYREYHFEGLGDEAVMNLVPESGLGILRHPDFHVFEGVHNNAALPPDVRDFLSEPRLLIVNKANVRSTVHRPVHLDAIAVKMFDRDGRVIGEHLFVGLFTSTVYTRAPAEIPLLRLKTRRVSERAGFPRASHDAKALEHILATYPRDELFQASDEDLYRISLGILNLQERQRVALFVRADPFHRFVSCFVFAPRENYSTDRRKRFAQILEEDFNAEVTAFYTSLSDDSVLARLHFILKIAPGQEIIQDITRTEARLAEAARSWADKLREALVTAHGEAAGLSLFRSWGSAFNAGYRSANSPEMGVNDIAKLQAIDGGAEIDFHVYEPERGDESFAARDGKTSDFRLRVYSPHKAIPISDSLPILERFGLRVQEELPWKLKPADRKGERLRVWVHDFLLQVTGASAVELAAGMEDFVEAFRRIWRGDMESDGFNGLILTAGLNWRETVVVRAYARYLRQTGVPFSIEYIQQTLNSNPKLVRQIVDLFLDHASPDGGRGEEILAAINEGLDQVTSLDEDRIIRRFVNLVGATLRTNFHQTDEAGDPKPWLSFKFSSRQIDELPLPRPLYEIWVYSPRAEGVHLRFGKVARGGLRWSDRHEDFRTEILGLVKAQVVKNAVIVPVGSKGGFVVKQPPKTGGREAQQKEGIACYQTFIRGMLDITDNIDGDHIVPPPDVVRHDEDDPYLVVAADKGTATFSDIANGVSEEYGFWLGDAFASGGSAGYDHKKMGITARGAWEAVKRHFREMGKNIQEEDFTAIGVGDMGGDVFGNGMLLSKHIRLVGAFNHLHIFVDPEPDAARTWEERKRLFDEVKGWADYDTSLISEGGGVFERSAKSIPVSPQMQRAFGIEAETTTPNELIRHMLRAKVELLWFGGIGTYVKATHETDAEVGDRGNDAIRINAKDLGAIVIGEGANLGMTQYGRIEHGLAGGRLNTDSIDNSAGVDCSDHEVNIKILLGDVMARTGMDRAARDRLLEDMTDEVAALVLRDNYLQTQAITVTEHLGASVTDRLARFMRGLERRGVLDRVVEDLPDDETIAERQQAGQGFTRPELAVLLSYAKIDLFDELMKSDLPDDEWLAEDLVRYFPKPLREDYEEAIERHRLRREIIATYVTNSVVNRAGISFVHDIAQQTGLTAADIARAYLMARQAVGARFRWDAVSAQDNKLSAEAQARSLLQMGRLLKQSTEWFLQYAERPLNVSDAVAKYVPGVEAFRANREAILTGSQRKAWQARADAHEADGWPEDVARRMADAPLLISALNVIRLSGELDRPLPDVGKTYLALGDGFGLDWLRGQATDLGPDAYWDKLAVAALIDDLYGHQARMTRAALANGAAPGDPAVASWAADHRDLVNRTQTMLDDMQNANALDVAMLAVANRQLRALAGG